MAEVVPPIPENPGEYEWEIVQLRAENLRLRETLTALETGSSVVLDALAEAYAEGGYDQRLGDVLAPMVHKRHAARAAAAAARAALAGETPDGG